MSIVLLGFIFALALLFVFKMVFAWTNPTQAPPGGSGTGIVPSGQVAFFNLSNCPSGWTEATSARGRYVVGKPSGGTLAGTAGTALSNLENRPVGQHTHSISDPGHTHGPGGGINSYAGGPSGEANWAFAGGSTGLGSAGNTGSAGTGISIQNAGSVAGTNAPYIQYLVCQKD